MLFGGIIICYYWCLGWTTISGIFYYTELYCPVYIFYRHKCVSFRFDSMEDVNPFVTNGLSHPYQLDESTFIFRGIGSNFSFLFHFSMKIK